MKDNYVRTDDAGSCSYCKHSNKPYHAVPCNDCTRNPVVKQTLFKFVNLCEVDQPYGKLCPDTQERLKALLAKAGELEIFDKETNQWIPLACSSWKSDLIYRQSPKWKPAPKMGWVECDVTEAQNGLYTVNTSNVKHLNSMSLALNTAAFRKGFGGIRFEGYPTWSMSMWYHDKKPIAVRFWAEVGQ